MIEGRRLAIGPTRDYPSWTWVGAGVVGELAKSFDIVLFDSFRRIPSCDAVLAIKQAPSLSDAMRLRKRGVRLVYVPIDRYASHAEIQSDRLLLEACDLVLSHDDLLLHCLKPYCTRNALVEHHGKYTLPAPASYRREGYVLWIGGFQHVPHLLDWLRRYPVAREVKLLTDWRNPAAQLAARRVAAGLELPLQLKPGTVNGYNMRLWNEAEQLRMMQECKAAIDIKGGDFSQATKPPTKAQQFISSGIPFACNAESTGSRYFRNRGFDLATPLDEERWFSAGYWRETAVVGTDLRRRISAEVVGESFRAALLSLWDR